MATHVYANGNEIASKSADGSSKHAFPDVCHTKPATASPTPIKPLPPGVPIPYPNSCHASDITNGSRTVFILGKEIALENHSYFSVSEGDQEATKFLARGLISAEVMGRCFFQTWSPNVKVEGRAVTRHLDLVSHNHKNPSNTALFPYISESKQNSPCKKEEGRIKSACDGIEDDDEQGRALRRKRTSMAQTRNARNPNAQQPTTAQSPWHERHCNGLLGVSSSIANTVKGDELDGYLAKFEAIKKEALEQAKDLTDFAGVLEREAKEWAERQAIKVVAKGAAKQVVGSFLPFAGNAVMGLHSAYEIYSNKAEMAEKLDEVKELTSAIEEVERIAERANRISERIEAAKNWKQGDPGESPSQLLFDLMDAQATLDACIRARKCNLVPHTSKTHFNEVGKSNVPTSDGITNANRGCCPGQTGHHLIPEAMIKTKPGEDSLGCSKYDHAAAPTVCAEGVNHSQGSHGRLHDNLTKELRTQKQVSDEKWFDFRKTIQSDGSMEMNDAIVSAARSHAASFPLSFCSPDCIEAQLRDFYLKDCKGANLRAVDKAGKPITTTEEDTRRR